MVSYLKQRSIWFVVFFSLVLMSCVTINIYFPAAAAEKAAEKIVDEVLNSGEGVVPSPATQPQSNHLQQRYNLQQPIDNSLTNELVAIFKTSLSQVVRFFIPTVHAQANINIDSPNINAIRNSLVERQSRLKPFFDAGQIGFTNNGLIASINLSGLAFKDRALIKKLIEADNHDRQALYREIARANGHPEWEKEIQATFAKTWINKIPKGWMYESVQGHWVKK